MDASTSGGLPSVDSFLGLSHLDDCTGDPFPLDASQALTDEPFLSALVDGWPELQHEQVPTAI